MGGLFPGELMEWKRGNLTCSAADTFTTASFEVDIDNPKGNKVLAIHQIEWEFSDFPTAVAAGDAMTAMITKESQSAMKNINTSDVVDKIRLTANGIATHIDKQPYIHKFDPPMVWLGNKDYHIAVDSTALGSAIGVYYRIGYTIRYLKANAFSDRMKRHID